MRKAGTGAVEWVQSVEKRLATNPAWSAQRACRRHIVGKLIICKEQPMPELSHIDPGSAALLVMDYQVDTLTRFMTAAQSADAVACVPDLIAMARDVGMMVIHVVVAFRPGHPEVSPRNRPCLAGLHERTRAVDLEKRRQSSVSKRYWTGKRSSLTTYE